MRIFNNQLFGYIGLPGNFGSLYLQSLGLYESTLLLPKRFSLVPLLLWPGTPDVLRPLFVSNKSIPIIKPGIIPNIGQPKLGAVFNIQKDVTRKYDVIYMNIPLMVTVLFKITPSMIKIVYFFNIGRNRTAVVIPHIIAEKKADEMVANSKILLFKLIIIMLTKSEQVVMIDIILLILLTSAFNSSITIINNPHKEIP